MKCLAVNTATKVLSIAIADGDKTLYLYETDETRDQGNILISHIQSGLVDCGLEFPDIDLLSVVVGPGSFTGIRVGLATMRGIALAAGKPLIGITSFDMFAAARPETINIIAVESWREELYFASLDDEAHPMIACMNETPEIFAGRFRHELPGDHDIVLSGDAVAAVMPFFPQAALADKKGDARDVARLALSRYKKGDVIPKPLPYYLREADITISPKKTRTLKAEGE